MKLIPLSEYVLQRVDKVTALQLANDVVAYTKFLRQPLTLSMFVPVDVHGVILEPLKFCCSGADCGCMGMPVNVNSKEEIDEYHEAQERVLFENVKIGSYGNGMYHFTGLGKNYLIINNMIYDDNQNSAPQKTEDKIEDLLQWNDNLELTRSALKLIGEKEIIKK